jgi:hypothetical protein
MLFFVFLTYAYKIVISTSVQYDIYFDFISTTTLVQEYNISLQYISIHVIIGICQAGKKSK